MKKRFILSFILLFLCGVGVFSSKKNINNKQIHGNVNAELVSSIRKPSLRPTTKQEILLENSDDVYFFGSRDAKGTIIEYSSYNCPHCISLHQNTMAKIKKDFIDTGKVKYVKNIFIQKNTMFAVLLPYCADGINRYSLVEDLYNNLNSWINSKNQTDELKKIALKHGFTENSFNQCIKNDKLANKIIKRQQSEARSLKIFSTPTLFINGKKVSGNIPYDELKTIIEKNYDRF